MGKKEKNSVSFESCCYINGEKWFFANEFNALCSMDEQGHITFKGMAPKEYADAMYLFADIKYYSKKLFLIPRGASALVVYDLEKDYFKRFEIVAPQNKNHYVDYLKFSTSLIYENKIYMIPRTYPALVIFDMENEEFEYEVDWLAKIKEYIFEPEAYFWSDYCALNNELILVGANNDCIVRRSFITGEYSVQHVANENLGFSGVDVVNGKIVTSRRKDGQLVVIDNNGTIEYLKMPESFSVNRIIGFSKLVRLNNHLYAIPMWANYLLKINIHTLDIDIIKDYDEDRIDNNEIASCCAWVENDNLCIDNNLNNRIDVCTVEGIIRGHELYVQDDFKRDRIKYISQNGILRYENGRDTLKNLIEYL